jgi:DNA-binding PadR family transcriptional regulator
MKAEGLLLSEWRNQENDLGSPVKFYYMTGQGKQLFNDMRVYIEDILQPILLTA